MRFRYQGVEFGGRSGSIIVLPSTDLGAAAVRGEFTDRPRNDGVVPGVSFLGSRTWAFDLVTNRRNLTDAYATEAALAAAWNDRTVRTTPGRKVPLSYELGDGKWRRVYGRPGQYDGPPADVRMRQGAGEITADFTVIDPRFFDELEQSVRLSIVPASGGGLRAPLSAPLRAGYAGEPRAGEVHNTGDAETPLVAEFHGPVKDPWVRDASGWWVGLKGTLAYDVSVTVDPLANTVRRSDGARVAGLLVGSRLSRCVVPPKHRTDLTFGGVDVTGTAWVDLRWRNASWSMGGPGSAWPEQNVIFGGEASTKNFDDLVYGEY